MNRSLRRLLHLSGGLLGLLGVFFVAERLVRYADQIDFGRFGPADWSILALFAVAYGSANVFLALAWRRLLAFFDLHVQPAWAVRAYGLSQVAKYVPGNIFHLAGRQAIGMAAGLPAWPLGKSAVWELGLISACGAFFAALTIPMLWPACPAVASLGIFALLTAAFVAGLRWFVSTDVSRAALWQMAFLTVSAIVFAGMVFVVEDVADPLLLLPRIGGAYIIAWLAGLITPGAPAGVGIREVALIYFLGETLSLDALLMAVVLGRVVTVLGDLFFFAASAAANRPGPHEPWVKQ